MSMGNALNKKGDVCPGCSTHQSRDEHHILPVEYGGASDGDTLYLCPNCHDQIHRLFNLVVAGKMRLQDTQNQVHRMLVGKIHLQWQWWIDNDKLASDARRRVVAHMSEEELAMVHFLRDHHNTGSIEKLLKLLVTSAFDKAISGKDL